MVIRNSALDLIDITPEDGDKNWIVTLGASSDADPLDENWWKCQFTVIISRVADESVESLTERAQATARKVLQGL